MSAEHIKSVFITGEKDVVTEEMISSLLQHGIKIYSYVPGMIHSASANVIPDIIVCVGCDDPEKRYSDHFREMLALAPVMLVSRKVLASDNEKLARVLIRLFTTKARIPTIEDVEKPGFDIALMKKAFDNREFELWYQPIIRRVSEDVTGFECLIRWKLPESCEIILPDRFMPSIENYDFIVPFGFWIIDEACRQLRVWQDKFRSDPPLYLSINLSARQFTCLELCDRIIKIIDAHGVDPSTVVLEITESAFMEDMERANLMLLKLRAKKIRIYLDDFGTGFASLSYLLHFPVDVIKIDKSFVKWMHVDEQSEEIVRSVIGLAHNLKMKVVAEGVETEEHRQKLDELGCDYMQGFLFAKPLDRERAERFYERSLDQSLLGFNKDEDIVRTKECS
jgi:EAL domain-containing protein (putative c-di-GMP-specific phosphodiesterase class I)